MSNIIRHAAGAMVAGQAAGGQFKAHERGAAAAPPAQVKNWGDTGLHVGSRTPWGEADHVEHPAEGISIVHTPSHGGIKLSPERNKEVPPALRNRNGWYEEDCEQHIACFIFPEELAYGEGAAYTREKAREGIKQWYPDEWEKAFGEKVTAEESTQVAEREWRAAHEGQLISHSAVTSAHNPDIIRVSVRNGSNDGWDEYLVPKAEYNEHKTRWGFVIDPARHPKLPPKAEQPSYGPVLRQYDVSERLAALPAQGRAAELVRKDLGQRWRNPSTGEVRTLQQILAREGAREVNVSYDDNGRATYAVVGNKSAMYRVSKATFDFLAEDIPDTTKESTRLYGAANRANAKYRRDMKNARTADQMRAARELSIEARRLAVQAGKAREAEQAAWDAQHGTYEERAARARDEYLVREAQAQVEGGAF